MESLSPRTKHNSYLLEHRYTLLYNKNKKAPVEGRGQNLMFAQSIRLLSFFSYIKPQLRGAFHSSLFVFFLVVV